MKREWVCWSWKGTALLWMALGVWTSGVGQRLTWLGTLPGYVWSEAYGVSANGLVVVGTVGDARGFFRPFRWSALCGMQDLGTLGGRSGVAFGVSANGSVVVGWAEDSGYYATAFRFSSRGGMQRILERASAAYGVSATGSVVVGVYGWGNESYAVRWTTTGGWQNLGSLGGNLSQAHGVSADGSVVVGWTTMIPFGSQYAFRWTAQHGMQGLGTLGGDWSVANSVSANGAVVVGVSQNANWQERAFRWTESGGMQELGTLPGYEQFSEARSVSADGSVVVGYARGAEQRIRAFRWTEQNGMEDMNQTYINLLRDGSSLSRAHAISPDARFIVGYGYNVTTRRWEAFLLDTHCVAHNGDVDGSECVDDADLLAVLFMFGSTGQDLGPTDVNCDGTVDDADLLTVLFNFGQGC